MSRQGGQGGGGSSQEDSCEPCAGRRHGHPGAFWRGRGWHGHPWHAHDWPGLSPRQLRHARRFWMRDRGLRRRLFLWFLGALILTTGLVATLTWIVIAEVHARRIGWPMALAMLVVFVLWGGAGRVARRLSRPFDELARVAEQLGEGHLDARVRLPFRAPLEIHVLGSALNDMAERIAQQLEDHRELLAGVSHELRTPLSRIRLLTELARAEPSAKTLDEIDREVVEMDALVDQLLVSSRLDFQQLSPKPLSAELLARRALERAGMAPTLLEVADPGEVEGDATLLGRALSNLIENAQRHGGGLTRLTVRREGQGVVSFAAEDEGPGFAEGDAERAFTAFFRGRGGENGTLGLGLSLVRRIAEAHGGTVFAMNRPDGGARVGFTLPARAP